MSRPRHQAREVALQVLYLWEVGRAAPDEAVDAYFDAHTVDLGDAGRAFVTELVHGTVGEVTSIDALIEQHSRHWRLNRLAVIDRLILRMAVWELRHQPETPPAVVLDEALELARTFSTDEAVGFVNGVLDAIRQTLAAPDGA
jgi:N utilization substance protein B